MHASSDGSGRREIFIRYDKNPILSAADWPYAVNAVFNPAAIAYDGETLLLVRVEGMDGLSHLTVARSRDGKAGWRIDSSPTLRPDDESFPEEVWGIEDPRIVKLDELGEYGIVYTSFSFQGPSVSLALTKDFRTFHRKGLIMIPENKDASLFPRRIRERWALLHRPVQVYAERAHIWISYSPDLRHWGDHTVVMETRKGGWWDACKVGIGPQPLETSEGWLIIYHGVRQTAAGYIYHAGLALLDLDDPRKVIRRTRDWVFGPKEDYERVGDVPGVVFPCGVVMDEDADELRLYYGAADTTVALATAKLRDLIDYLKTCPE